jgi:hypothetical protein
LPFWANVSLGKCLSWQSSFWANVFLGKCLSGQTSFWANVVWANVLLGKRRMGKCLWANVSGQMSYGQMSWNHVKNGLLNLFPRQLRGMKIYISLFLFSMDPFLGMIIHFPVGFPSYSFCFAPSLPFLHASTKLTPAVH